VRTETSQQVLAHPAVSLHVASLDQGAGEGMAGLAQDPVDSANVHRRALAAPAPVHTPPGRINVPPGHPRIICSYIWV
jgi:hypothetical protein